MILRNSGLPANTGRCPYAGTIERVKHILSVAKQYVPHLVIDGARVDMAKWRVLVRASIADLASRGQSLDEEFMRDYFTYLVEQAECIHGNWAAAIRDYHKSKNIEAEKITLTPPGRKSRRDRVIEAILLFDGIRTNLKLAAMLKIHPKIVKGGIAEFGTWKKAVEAAGLNYSNYGPYANWTDNDFLLNGKELMKAKKFDLVRLFIEDIDFATAIYERFKDWEEYKIAVENYVPEPLEDKTDEAPEPGQGPEA